MSRKTCSLKVSCKARTSSVAVGAVLLTWADVDVECFKSGQVEKNIWNILTRIKCRISFTTSVEKEWNVEWEAKLLSKRRFGESQLKSAKGLGATSLPLPRTFIRPECNNNAFNTILVLVVTWLGKVLWAYDMMQIRFGVDLLIKRGGFSPREAGILWER